MMLAHRRPLGTRATQVKLWRSRTATVQGLASLLFDIHLLGRFDTIMPGSRHTMRGREFWEVQLAGHSQTKGVGLMGRDDIYLYDPRKPVDDWLGEVEGWGLAPSFRQNRFFISDRTPAGIRAAS